MSLLYPSDYLKILGVEELLFNGVKVMEWWVVGKEELFFIYLLHFVKGKFMHYSNTPSLQYSNWAKGPVHS